MIRELEGLGTSPEGWSSTRPLAVKWTGSVQPKLVAARGFLDEARKDHGEFMRACQTVLKPRARTSREEKLLRE
jgi:hypothetical protein